MNKQIDKKCKDCLHYKMCLERFRKLKKENYYILIDENEYFAHADDCEFHIKTNNASNVVNNIFNNLRILGHIDFDGNIVIRKDSFEGLEKAYKKQYESEELTDEQAY